MKRTAEWDRAIAVQRFLGGEAVSSIARSLGYSRKWIYKWVQRHQAQSGDEAWYQDRPSDPRSCPRRLPGEMVEIIKLARLHLYNQDLFCGAQAIQWELRKWEVQPPLPSLRTINRILSREGLTHRRTGRYESKGRKYPSLVGEAANAVHQMDFVGPCYLTGPLRFYSLNSVDLATGRCAINPVLCKAAQETLDAVWAGWCRLGIPQHQQVDNEMVFYGSRQHPRGMGPLIRLCLLYDVQPWFIPMAEPWRNGVVEKFNDHYEKGLLRRIPMQSVEDLRRESLLFEQKHNAQYRYSKLQGQTPQAALEQSGQTLRFPDQPQAPRHPLPKPVKGRYHRVRFIRSDRWLDVFGERFLLPAEALYEYVIASVDVGLQKLRVHIEETTLTEFDYCMRQ